MIDYAKGLESLMKRLEDWKNKRESKFDTRIISGNDIKLFPGDDISISLGRFAKNISTLSKQVPKALSLSLETAHIFELRSSVNKGKYLTILLDFINLH
jgi:hypothetical protein